MGHYVDSIYELDDGEKYRIKISSDHYDVLSTKSALGVGSASSLPASIKPRKVVCVATDGSARREISVLSKTDWNSDAFGLGQTITCQGKQYVIVAKIPEKAY